MPFITVWNWASGDKFANDPFNVAELRSNLRKACLGISELGLTEDADVTVCLAGSPEYRGGGPIIVVVELLFDKPERTLEVRQRLASALGESVKAYYRRYAGIDQRDREVEVAVKRFNPERDAFWKG